MYVFLFSLSTVQAQDVPVLPSQSMPDTLDEWMESVPLIISGAQYCTGVLIDSHTVATAYHCVVSGRQPLLKWEDGTQELARIAFADPKNDLALLKIETTARAKRNLRGKPCRSCICAYFCLHA